MTEVGRKLWRKYTRCFCQNSRLWRTCRTAFPTRMRAISSCRQRVRCKQAASRSAEPKKRPSLIVLKGPMMELDDWTASMIVSYHITRCGCGPNIRVGAFEVGAETDGSVIVSSFGCCPICGNDVGVQIVFHRWVASPELSTRDRFPGGVVPAPKSIGQQAMWGHARARPEDIQDLVVLAVLQSVLENLGWTANATDRPRNPDDEDAS